ncbi:unnamed protein product [Ostreobium quekettii]|uniref:Uncharacterized protein n=1 Tax=Ostreobium quekettii TaxID=121088 RepID=A0A8S1IPD3_9CHLO|nr:unnamed protein product [Ostreobium quekettii]|eukprot:evm.model.scf_1307EXC.1 EVM.evm.TU.scf_1307EXC.1   scf_1307EXC:2374-5160(-)
MLSTKPLVQWTVVELKAELKSRGLTSSGVKADLIKRVQGAIDQESAKNAAVSGAGDRVAAGESAAGDSAAELPVNGKGHGKGSAQAGAPAGAEEDEEANGGEPASSGERGTGCSAGEGPHAGGSDGAGDALPESRDSAGGKDPAEGQAGGDAGPATGVGDEEDAQADGDYLALSDGESEGDGNNGAAEEALGNGGEGATDGLDLEALAPDDDLEGGTNDLTGRGSGAPASEPVAATATGGGEKAGEVPAGAGNTPASVVQEWKGMAIPAEWLPLPMIQVNNVPKSCTLEELQRVLEAEGGLKVKSVVFNDEVRLPDSQAALVRLVPPPLPWLGQEGGDEVKPGEEAEAMDEDKTEDHAEAKAGEGEEEVKEEKEVAVVGSMGSNAADGPDDAQVAKADDKEGKPQKDAKGGKPEPTKEEDAAGPEMDVKAVSHFHVRQLDARSLKIGDSSLAYEVPLLKTTFFVGNLREEWGESDDAFREEMQKYGTLERCFIVRNKDGGSKDYAFVEYSLPSQALKAKDAVEVRASETAQRAKGDSSADGTQRHGQEWTPRKRLRSEWAYNHSLPSIFSRICYVANLPAGFMNQGLLRRVFEQHGQVVYTNIKLGVGSGPGCGFVEFTSGENAEKAMYALNGTSHPDLGYILVSLVNPAKFLTDKYRTDRGGPGRRGRGRDFHDWDYSGRSGRGRRFYNQPMRGGDYYQRLGRGPGRGRGGRTTWSQPLTPQYSYGMAPYYMQQAGGSPWGYYDQYQQYGQYSQGSHAQGYYQGSGRGYQSHQHHSGGNRQHHGRGAGSGGSGRGSYGSGQGYGYGSHGYQAGSGYGHQYGVSGYGQGYGGQGYGSSTQYQSQTPYQGSSYGSGAYGSGYGGYGSGYQASQSGYGGSSYGYGGQTGYGYSQDMYAGQQGYGQHAGDKHSVQHGESDYAQQNAKRPRN